MNTTSENISHEYIIVPIYIITGAIIEEIIFRKIIFMNLNKYLPFFMSAFISSLIYSLMHLNNARFIGYLAVGYILCVIYKKSNTILSTIIIHIILNIAGLISISLNVLY
ncbi:CPBP family intramembrane glutamic endopeptidase [Paenibacillus puerhi]|uniref:CPBP family intramembrane glutamic endopeptidase n=1 Tax=Paenibacillus puerhi TaxID=2692622 RepID=UPI0038B40CA9